MHIHIIYCHHEPGSFTAAMMNTAVGTLSEAGHTIEMSDLYAMKFNPVANAGDITDKKSGEYIQYMLEQQRTSKAGTLSQDILLEFNKVRKADLLIFVTPIWWFSVPAMLKGWFDRVFATGLTWDFGAIYDKGLLRGKKALLVAMPGGPEELYQHDGAHRATLKEILHPILWGTLHFCGLDVLEPFVTHSPFQLGEDGRKKRLEEFSLYLKDISAAPMLYRHK